MTHPGIAARDAWRLPLLAHPADESPLRTAAEQTGAAPPGLSAAVRHALLENEWQRALVETPMRISKVYKEMHALAGLLDDIVRPALAGLVRRAAG